MEVFAQSREGSSVVGHNRLKVFFCCLSQSSESMRRVRSLRNKKSAPAIVVRNVGEPGNVSVISPIHKKHLKNLQTLPSPTANPSAVRKYSQWLPHSPLPTSPSIVP